MRLRTTATATALLPLLAGCLDVTTPNSGRAGFMTISTYDDGASGFVISPVAGFYAASSLQYVAPQLETCQLLAYTGLSNFPSGTRTLDAGPELALALPGRTDVLLPEDQFGLQVYVSPLVSGIPHVPGDTLRVTVPGGTGYPAVALSLRTAEDFTHSPVGVGTQNEDLIVDWTPAPADGSVMIVSLRYANEISSGVVNQQVRCAFTDDGSGTIPGFLVSGWNASVGDRETVFSRIRFIEVDVGGDARMTLLSTFNRPLAPLPQP
jgi:hypothetical protein